MIGFIIKTVAAAEVCQELAAILFARSADLPTHCVIPLDFRKDTRAGHSSG